jgi:hypothetical protein
MPWSAPFFCSTDRAALFQPSDAVFDSVRGNVKIENRSAQGELKETKETMGRRGFVA